MNQIPYLQCSLEQRTPGSNLVVQQVSWIPQRYASLGQGLSLKNERGRWTHNWTVTSVGTVVRLQAELPDSYRAIQQHRRNTGDGPRKPKAKLKSKTRKPARRRSMRKAAG